jgi:hypothetical protein
MELRLMLLSLLLELLVMPMSVSSLPSYVPLAIPELGPSDIVVPLFVTVIKMSQPAVA